MVPNPNSISVGTQPEPKGGPAARFVVQILPWLLGGFILLVFGLTLNPGLTPANIGLVAARQGLTWSPQLHAPLTWLVTQPFAWLPAAWIPLALNGFTAVCAAICCGWLARSVALLPHDLSRKAADPLAPLGFAPPPLMTDRGPWLPPLFAVLVFGLQLTGWENAVCATGRMMDLVLFAYVLRAIFEFNATNREAWLLRGAFVYGLAVANNPSQIIWLPVLGVAVLAAKRLLIFNYFQLELFLQNRANFKYHLLWQIPALGLAGLSFILLLPVAASLDPHVHMDLWPALKITLSSAKAAMLQLPRPYLVSTAVIALLTLGLVLVPFYQVLAGLNHMSQFFAALFFQGVYAFMMLAGFWIELDSPLSPRRLLPGLDTLPLYFLVALSLGHLLGHFLLTSRVTVAPLPDGPLSFLERREQQLRQFGKYLKYVALAAVILLAITLPANLAGKNWPLLRRHQADDFAQYIHQLEKNLPATPSVILGNDNLRLTALQSALIGDGRQNQCLIIDAPALVAETNYLAFLSRRNPGFDLAVKLPDLNDPSRPKRILLDLIDHLATSNRVFCLPPVPVDDLVSEIFYYRPAELLMHLDRYAETSAFAPPMSREVLEENARFWQQFHDEQFTNLVLRSTAAPPQSGGGLGKRFFNTLRFGADAEVDAVLAGSYYATALNDWGVALQQNGEFAAAGRCFAEALALNPRHAPAQINQQFNADYQANRELTIQKPLETAQNMNKYRDWRYVLAAGAVDEPNFCCLAGAFLGEKRLYRPAIAQLERVKALCPARLDTYLALADLFNETGDYVRALEAENLVLNREPTNVTALFIKANTEMRDNTYLAALPLLDQFLSLSPSNQLARLDRAIAYRRLNQFDQARQDYLVVIQNSTNAFPAYYDLAEMDFALTNLPSAITNYQLFLQCAPPQMKEIAKVKARLASLGVKLEAPGK